MSFTDGKPHIITEADLRAPWFGIPNGEKFYCRMCGHQFELGETYRWVYGGTLKPARINLLVCSRCDGEDILERYQQWWQEWEQLAKGKFRYIADRLDYAERHISPY